MAGAPAGYLKAISVRLQKLTNAGPLRDYQLMLQVRPLWREYIDRHAAQSARGIVDPQLGTFRWMIEELRVSLHAQELRAAVPVSVQRLQKQLDLVTMA